MNPVEQAARKLHEAGYLIVPCSNKVPAVPKNSKVNNGWPIEKFNGAPQVGLIMKPDKECLDFDNKFSDADEIFDKYTTDPRVAPIVADMFCESTPSGGYHLIYKCSVTAESHELASRLKIQEDGTKKKEALIETRGGSNYAVVYPSPDYIQISTSDLINLKEITPQEREILLTVAREYDEMQSTPQGDPQEETKGYDHTDPVSWFNWNKSGYAKNLLKEKGWTLISTDENQGIENWRRPGKIDGMSATWGRKHNALYCFSTSVEYFKTNCYYTPFQIIVKLRYNGNHGAALKWIISKYFPDEKQSKNKTANKSNIISAMERNQLASATPDPRPLYYNIWNENEIAIGAGDTGVGKSLLAVSILNDLCRERKVLYYDFELSPKQFEARYKGYQFPENFLIAEWEPDPDDTEATFNIDTILADIDGTGADIVCVDNITALSLKNTVDSDAAMGVMRGLKKLQKESGISVLVLAHTPKRPQSAPITINDLAGSKHLANFADSVFFINFSMLGHDIRYIKHVKTRTPKLCDTFGVVIEKGQDGMIRLVFDGYLGEHEHLTGESIDDRASTAGSLRDREHKSQTQIAQLMKISQATVNRLLKKYDDQKMITNEAPF